MAVLFGSVSVPSGIASAAVTGKTVNRNSPTAAIKKTGPDGWIMSAFPTF
jgi:hypothetical protein